MKKILFTFLGFLLLIVVAFIAMISPACRQLKSASKIYGNYLADYDVASERLVLNPDGTFSQELTIRAIGAHDTAIGRWNYNPKSGYITFDRHFLVPIDGTGKFNPDYMSSKRGSGASYPVERYPWGIYIGSAEGVLYKKQ